MLLPIISILLAIAGSWVWVSLSSSAMSYKTLSTAKQYTQQFEIAEYTLAQAEQWLRATSLLPEPVVFCAQRPCVLHAQQASYLPSQETAWWQTPNNYAVTPISAETSFYAIEQLIESSSPQIHYYRITSWTLLNTDLQPTILQSVWVKNAENKWEGRNAWRKW